MLSLALLVAPFEGCLCSLPRLAPHSVKGAVSHQVIIQREDSIVRKSELREQPAMSVAIEVLRNPVVAGLACILPVFPVRFGNQTPVCILLQLQLRLP